MMVSVGFTAPIDGKEAGVGDIKIVELVRLAVQVEHGGGRVRAEAAGAGLVRRAADRDVLAEIETGARTACGQAPIGPSRPSSLSFRRAAASDCFR